MHLRLPAAYGNWSSILRPDFPPSIEVRRRLARIFPLTVLTCRSYKITNADNHTTKHRVG